ncbi:hypothetical protein D3C81_1178200 [compost metagenome]
MLQQQLVIDEPFKRVALRLENLLLSDVSRGVCCCSVEVLGASNVNVRQSERTLYLLTTRVIVIKEKSILLKHVSQRLDLDLGVLLVVRYRTACVVTFGLDDQELVRVFNAFNSLSVFGQGLRGLVRQFGIR